MRRNRQTVIVAISFASPDADRVRPYAHALGRAGVEPYFSADRQDELAGRDLTNELERIFGHAASLCLVFGSQAYARRAWPNIELGIAIARLERLPDFVVPIRLDGPLVCGLESRVHLEAAATPPEELVRVIERRLAVREAVAGNARWRWAIAGVAVSLIAGMTGWLGVPPISTPATTTTDDGQIPAVFQIVDREEEPVPHASLAVTQHGVEVCGGLTDWRGTLRCRVPSGSNQVVVRISNVPTVTTVEVDRSHKQFLIAVARP